MAWFRVAGSIDGGVLGDVSAALRASGTRSDKESPTKRMSAIIDQELRAWRHHHRALRSPLSELAPYFPVKNFAAPVIAKVVKSPRTANNVASEPSGETNG
jgi:hypothetical protein